jgi:hypothetical protein
VNVQQYIESGVLEAYVLGAASEAETQELLSYKKRYPQIQDALEELERDMEYIAEQMAIIPPPITWSKIEASINEITITPDYEPLRLRGREERSDYYRINRENYIEVAEAESTYIRVHKNWKWVFVAVFVLSKIFLACAIYFYLENRQAQQQILDLKTELKLHQTH